jgi:hypothetical protein
MVARSAGWLVLSCCIAAELDAWDVSDVASVKRLSFSLGIADYNFISLICTMAREFV